MRLTQLLKKLPYFAPFVFAAGGIFLIVSSDTFEWLYSHSRRYEDYQYDELVLWLFLVLIIGMLRLAFHLYKKAAAEPSPPRIRFGLRRHIQMMGRPLPDSYHSPLRLLLSLLAVIVSVEVLDMIILDFLPPLSKYALAFIDSFFLVLMISPALYLVFLRPLLDQIFMRERIEESLMQLNQQLEERIEQRTAQLQSELKERRQTEARLMEHQKQLRALSLQLTIVEERERLRIASALHDNIGHVLAMVNNRLELLKATSSDDEGGKVLGNIQELVMNAIRFSRSLGSELSPPLINFLPFVSAVEWLAEDILESGGVAFILKIDGSPQLPTGDARTIFFKVIREVMINIVKHAKARTADITVGTDSNGIVVEIKDDGIGCDVEATPPIAPEDWRGFGIFLIRERMAYLNGRFLVQSRPGQGTRVVLSLPSTQDTAE